MALNHPTANTEITTPVTQSTTPLLKQVPFMSEASTSNLEDTNSAKETYSSSGSASPYSDSVNDICYKTGRLFTKDLGSIGLNVLQVVPPGVGLGGGAFLGHVFTDSQKIVGPTATGIQASLAVTGTALGLGCQNSWKQPRTPTGEKSHTPGVFTHNAEGLEFEKASRNQTPGINCTKLTYPNTKREEDSDEGKPQSSFICPLTLLTMTQNDSLFGSHAEIEDDFTPFFLLVFSLTTEMHKEQIKEEVLRIKENVFTFIKSKFN